MLLYRTKTNDDLDWCVNHGIHNRAKNFLKVHFKGNEFLSIWSFHHRQQKILILGGLSFLKQLSWTSLTFFTSNEISYQRENKTKFNGQNCLQFSC